MADHCANHERFDFLCADCKRGRVEDPLRFHDTHRATTPCCGRTMVWTDSPSMMQEARADGIPTDELPLLLAPVEVKFQGLRSKLFRVQCQCGKSYVSFIDVVNRDRIERARSEVLPYNPGLEDNDDFKKRWLNPQYRDVLVTPEEFARRVSLESNHRVREAIERKCTEAGFGVTWVRPKYVAGFATD